MVEFVLIWLSPVDVGKRRLFWRHHEHWWMSRDHQSVPKWEVSQRGKRLKAHVKCPDMKAKLSMVIVGMCLLFLAQFSVMPLWRLNSAKWTNDPTDKAEAMLWWWLQSALPVDTEKRRKPDKMAMKAHREPLRIKHQLRQKPLQRLGTRMPWRLEPVCRHHWVCFLRLLWVLEMLDRSDTVLSKEMWS